MSLHLLVGTILIGALFVAVMFGASRMDVHSYGQAGDDGYVRYIEQFDETVSAPMVFRGAFGVAALLVVVLAAVILGPLQAILQGMVVLAVFVLLALLVFVGSYGFARQNGLGTAHAITAGLFLVGLVFVLLIATDLLGDVQVVR